MGFSIPKRRSALLTFPGTNWEGAEVRILMAPLGVVLALEEMPKSEGVTSTEYFEMVAEEIILEWNLEDDDGKPIPSNMEGLTKVPLEFVTMILKGLRANVMDVPDPLDEPSPNGKQSQADTMLELADSSQNLGASNGLN